MREREIESLGDHLARLLQQADQLLREWKTFSDGLRAALAGQVSELDASLARAVADAARGLGPRAAAELERELGQTIDLLRKDLQALREAARRAAGELEGRRARRTASDWRRHLPVLAIALALTANALLVALLLRAPAAPLPVQPAPVTLIAAPDAAPAPALPVAPLARPDAAPAMTPAAAPAAPTPPVKQKRPRPSN